MVWKNVVSFPRESQEDNRNHNQRRQQERPQQPLPTDELQHHQRENKSARETAKFLRLRVIRIRELQCSAGERLGLRRRFAGGLLLHLGLHLINPGHNHLHLLQCAERDAVTARHHQRGDDRRPADAGENSSAMLGRLSVPAAFFAAHLGDSGRNGRITISGSAGMMPLISV